MTGTITDDEEDTTTNSQSVITTMNVGEHDEVVDSGDGVTSMNTHTGTTADTTSTSTTKNPTKVQKSTKSTTTMITLISNDHKEFHIPLSVAKLSGFIVDTLGLDDDEDSNNDNDNEDDNEDDNNNHNDNTNTVPMNDQATTSTTSNNTHIPTQKNIIYEPIHIPRVHSLCLQKVIDFLYYYHDTNPLPKIQQPIIGDTLNEIITDPWYQNYLVTNTTSEQRMLFHVCAAANFMEIAPLLDLTCLWCTYQISGKSAEEIRVFLNLPSMTPEEEARARQDHPWIFESIS